MLKQIKQIIPAKNWTGQLNCLINETNCKLDIEHCTVYRNTRPIDYLQLTITGSQEQLNFLRYLLNQINEQVIHLENCYKLESGAVNA